MPYAKLVSRAMPGFILLLLDDSGSMSDPLSGTSDAKYLWVERYFGIILRELLARCGDFRGDTVIIKPRYYLHTVLYGSTPAVWGGGELDIQATVEKYTQAGNSLGLGGHLGGTDSAAAFQQAKAIIERAVTDPRFQQSFPLMLFHLTDGESQTDAASIAEQIKQFQTADGNVLIVNAYVGTQTSLNYQGPEDFPGYVQASDVGPKPDNLRLFDMSSEMPETIRQNLIHDGIFPNLREKSRLFFDVRTKEMLKYVIQVVGSIGSRVNR